MKAIRFNSRGHFIHLFTNCFTNCLFPGVWGAPFGGYWQGRRYFWIFPDACGLRLCGSASGTSLKKRPCAVLFRWWDGEQIKFIYLSIWVMVIFRWLFLFSSIEATLKAGRPARTYIQQLCEDTGCSPENLPVAMNDNERSGERWSGISMLADLWWWWWFIYFLLGS